MECLKERSGAIQGLHLKRHKQGVDVDHTQTLEGEKRTGIVVCERVFEPSLNLLQGTGYTIG